MMHNNYIIISDRFSIAVGELIIGAHYGTNTICICRYGFTKQGGLLNYIDHEN